METQAMEVKHIPNHHPITVAIIKLLERLISEQTISYSEITEHCGCQVKPGAVGYSYLMSARKYVEKSKGLVFAPIRGQGILKCLNSGEVVETTTGTVTKTRRLLKRAARRIVNVDESQLTEDQKKQVRTNSVIIGTASLFLSNKTARAIADNGSKIQPDHNKILALFDKCN